MESAAHGIQLSRVVHRLGYFADCKKIEEDFSRIFTRVVELTAVLQKLEDVRSVPAEWRKIPDGIQGSELRAAIEGNRYFSARRSPSTATWTQHGDLSVENICVNHESSRIEVFDWDELASGFPPLYDFFQFFYSISYLSPADEGVRFVTTEERWIASFNAIFFGQTEFACIVRKLLRQACERTEISADLIPALLIEFLIFRLHFYEHRSAGQHRTHTRLLQLCVERLYQNTSDDIFTPPPAISTVSSIPRISA